MLLNKPLQSAMKPEITVLMPVYNGAAYIREAVDSILNQTLRGFEFLIINDGSTDATEEIIRSYTDPRIRVVNQPNGGVSRALNNGLALASGSLIARFDADDICYATRLEKQYEFMQSHPDYVIVGSNADYINKEGDYIFTFEMAGHSDEEIRAQAPQACPFIHSTVMYRKQAVLQVGGYEVKAHGFEDYFLWMKLINTGKGFNFNTPMIRVRFNPESVTVDSRDYSRSYQAIHKKALLTGTISEEDEQQILAGIRKLDKRKKEISYNRMLGKKYLWNNYQPGKARMHLAKAIRMEPLNYRSYLLYLLSLFPEQFIRSLYNTFD